MKRTVKELKLIAKEMGLKGYSKLNKAELIELIEGTQTATTKEEKREQANINKSTSTLKGVFDAINKSNGMYRVLGFEYVDSYVTLNYTYDVTISYKVGNESKALWMRLEHDIDPKYNDVTFDTYYIKKGTQEYQYATEFCNIVTELLKTSNKIKFKPQDTAIPNGNSRSAKMLAKEIKDGESVVDVGCGKGRNIKYILENTSCKVVVDGSDIREQLDKEQDNHMEIMEKYTMDSTFKRSVIDLIENLPSNHYDYALNSHVLNVIEEDSIKNEVVRNVYNALVEGGKAYFEVRTQKDIEKSTSRIKYGNGWWMPTKNTYQEVISEEKMINLLVNNGFKIVEHICNSLKHIVICEK